jgi:hypothetical protein
VSFADHVDESIHVGIDQITEIVELIGGRRVPPVHHIDVTSRFDEISDERAIILQVENIPMPDHRVRHEYRSLYAARMIQSDPVQCAPRDAINFFARCLGNLNIRSRTLAS